MKLSLTVLSLSLVLASCGNERQESKDTHSTDAQTAAKLNQEHSVAANIVTRVPVVNGQPDYSKVEAVSVAQSMDASDSNALAAVFAGSNNKIALTSVVTDDLDEGSTQQFFGCRHGGCSGPYPRSKGYILPWRRRQANLNNDLIYATGLGGHYQPYQQRSSCCCVEMVCQPTCSMGMVSTYSTTYQYSSFQSSGNWYGSF
jgi:hypothetical protein